MHVFVFDLMKPNAYFMAVVVVEVVIVVVVVVVVVVVLPGTNV